MATPEKSKTIRVLENIRWHWEIVNYNRMAEVNRKSLVAWANFILEHKESPTNGINHYSETVKPPNSLELSIRENKLYMDYSPGEPGDFIIQASLYGAQGHLLAGDLSGGCRLHVLSELVDEATGKTRYWIPGLVNKYCFRADATEMEMIRKLEVERKRALGKTISLIRELQDAIKNKKSRYDSEVLLCKALGKYMGIWPNKKAGNTYDLEIPFDKMMYGRLDEICAQLQKNNEFTIDSNSFYFDDTMNENVGGMAVWQNLKGMVLNPKFSSEKYHYQLLVFSHEYFHVGNSLIDNYDEIRSGMKTEKAVNEPTFLSALSTWVYTLYDAQYVYGVEHPYIKPDIRID